MTVNVVADTPEFNQGEIEVNPSPAPNDRRTRVVATAAMAPAKIAAQLTAERADSSEPELTTPNGAAGDTVFMSVPDQGKNDDDGNRHAKKPKQNPTANVRFSPDEHQQRSL